ncbi:MAG: AsmA-like C-terminal region-containing protein [Chthoniobacteraceae bacterium]
MRRFLFALFIILLGGMTAGAWYAYDKGFTKSWRALVADEFREHGVEVSLRRLKLDPFRGLVAHDVKVFDARDQERVLAVVSEISLGINYANAIRGQTFLDTLDLRDATLTLPLDPADPGGKKVKISKLNARLFLPPRQIYLARAEAEIEGVRIYLTGRLINPQAFRPKETDGGKFPGELAERILDELRDTNFEGEPPLLAVEFTGDLAKPDEVMVKAKLTGEKIKRRSYLLEKLAVAATYHGGLIDVQQFELQDATGAVHAYATVDPKIREATLKLQSTIDLPALIQAYGLTGQLEEFVFYDTPRVELDGKAKFGDELEFAVLGRMDLKKFSYRSMTFESLSAAGSWDGTRWSVRDVRLAHRTGELTGDVVQTPGVFRAHLRSTIHPRLVTPLLRGKVAEWFSQFEFQDAPTFEIDVRGTEPTLDGVTVEADLKIGRASYRGVGAKSFTAKARYKERVLSLSPFRVDRKEGSGTGGLVFDFKRNEVRLEKIRAQVYPPEVAPWISRNFIKDIAPYRFKNEPPNILLDGVVHTKGGDTTKLAVDVSAPGGMDYTFLRKDLSFPDISGKLSFTRSRFTINSLEAELFGGKLSGSAEFSLLKARPGYSADMWLEGVDFARLTDLYFNYDNSKGQVQGNFRFTGRHDRPHSLKGDGQLTVANGDVFAIPFLGPFSGVLNGIVPGMGYNTARKATAAFTVANGTIATDNLVIEGTGFNMFGNGKLFYLDDRMDFAMRINARGLPGVLLFPVSKLFEYVADEKLSKPVWRPKALPRL